MSLTLELSENAEHAVRESYGEELNSLGQDALLIEAYRSGRMGLRRLARAVGLETSIQAAEWLAQRRVPLCDIEDFRADMATFDRMKKEGKL